MVIPTLNEASELPETLRRLRAVPEVKEVIIADGGSRDDTVKLAEAADCVVVNCAPGRGRQLRAGAERQGKSCCSCTRILGCRRKRVGRC